MPSVINGLPVMWLQDRNVRTCCECSIRVFMQATSVTYNNVSLANYYVI